MARRCRGEQGGQKENRGAGPKGKSEAGRGGGGAKGPKRVNETASFKDIAERVVGVGRFREKKKAERRGPGGRTGERESWDYLQKRRQQVLYKPKQESPKFHAKPGGRTKVLARPSIRIEGTLKEGGGRVRDLREEESTGTVRGSVTSALVLLEYIQWGRMGLRVLQSLQRRERKKRHQALRGQEQTGVFREKIIKDSYISTFGN